MLTSGDLKSGDYFFCSIPSSPHCQPNLPLYTQINPVLKP